VTQAQAEPPVPQGLVDPTQVQTYVLRPGDTLQTLSIQFGMSVQDLKKLNNLRDADEVSVGQRLLHYKGSLTKPKADSKTTTPADAPQPAQTGAQR
jgi:LysM repeat protein